MASFTTTITEFSDKENARTYMVSGHTVQAPKWVIQKRVTPSTPEAVAKSQLIVAYGTEDADGNLLPSRVIFEASVRYPANGESADVTAALAIFRDFVASDEFTTLVNTQAYVQ